MEVAVEVVNRKVVRFNITQSELDEFKLTNQHQSVHGESESQEGTLRRIAILLAKDGELELGNSGCYLCATTLTDYTFSQIISN